MLTLEFLILLSALDDFGNEKTKIAPFPNSDSTHIRPPMLSIIFLQIERPKPVPSYSDALLSL